MDQQAESKIHNTDPINLFSLKNTICRIQNIQDLGKNLKIIRIFIISDQNLLHHLMVSKILGPKFCHQLLKS